MAEKIKEYECCALFRPDLEPEQLDSVIDAVRKLIEEQGGQIARIDRWNKRFLAFAIQDHTEGYYVIYRWLSSKDVLKDLSYHLKFSDDCLRFLILDYTERERKRRKRLGKAKTTEV